MLLEKYAETIIEQEATLGRELTDIEKEAVWATVGKAAGLAANVLKNFTPAKMSQWAKGINLARTSTQGATAGTRAKFMWETSKNVNPSMHNTVVGGGLIGAGGVAGAGLGAMLPRQEKNAGIDPLEHEAVEKTALTDEQQNHLQALMTGTAVGAGLGVGGVLLNRYRLNNNIMRNTENIRDLGNSVLGVQNFNKRREAEEFERLFEDIADNHTRRVTMNLVTDLKKAMNDTYRGYNVNIPGAHAIDRNLWRNQVDAAHAQGEINTLVRDHLHDYINNLGRR